MTTKETAVFPAGTVLRPTRLAHVVLKTPNFTSMVAWYKPILGAHASSENPGLSFLTYDDEHHRVAIGNFPERESFPRESDAGYWPAPHRLRVLESAGPRHVL